MSLLKHRCWYCKHESRNVDYIPNDYAGAPPSPWQCKDRERCETQRQWLEAKIISGGRP